MLSHHRCVTKNSNNKLFYIPHKRALSTQYIEIDNDDDDDKIRETKKS